jgi:hypothetical protein
MQCYYCLLAFASFRLFAVGKHSDKSDELFFLYLCRRVGILSLNGTSLRVQRPLQSIQACSFRPITADLVILSICGKYQQPQLSDPITAYHHFQMTSLVFVSVWLQYQ